MTEEDKQKSIVDEAREAAEALKAQNDRKEQLLKQEEEMEARRALGGQSNGAPHQEPPKETTPKEEVARMKEVLRRGY